jgi:REP element-mobilizing transposase RayT
MSDSGRPQLDPLRFPRRKSVRLKEHDYVEGTYFITICVRDRRSLLSTIENSELRPTRLGKIVAEEWLRTNLMRTHVLTDAFVVMPDHFHGIVGLGPRPTKDGLKSRAHDGTVEDAVSGAHAGTVVGQMVGAASPALAGAAVGQMVDPASRAHAVRPYDLGRFVAGFKSSCTRQYRELTGQPGAALWQRGYYECIIGGMSHLERIRRYIADNPRRS